MHLTLQLKYSNKVDILKNGLTLLPLSIKINVFKYIEEDEYYGDLFTSHCIITSSFSRLGD